jgi:DNA repair photolyase
MRRRPPGLRLVDNPPNPWLGAAVEYLPGEDDETEAPIARLKVIEDRTRTIVAENDSPDLGFRWSLNPYRGCWHACSYCYARPRHELLGFGAGTDFERMIVVKPEAPALLREAFERPSWSGELVLFSGDTDCYQPLEASYRLTRACLEVCAEYRNPCAIITKAPLIERDVDVLIELAQVTDVGVTITVPFWDPAKAKAMEPYVATPQRRIKTIEALATAGIDVGVNVAPMIPGLGDEDIPLVLAAAAGAGATRAGFIFLRLPGPVADVFTRRLREALPLRADKVIARVREARGGKLYDARFGARQRGEGRYAEAARALFEATARRLGLRTGCPARSGAATFRRPPKRGDQMRLFE